MKKLHHRFIDSWQDCRFPCLIKILIVLSSLVEILCYSNIVTSLRKKKKIDDVIIRYDGVILQFLLVSSFFTYLATKNLEPRAFSGSTKYCSQYGYHLDILIYQNIWYLKKDLKKADANKTDSRSREVNLCRCLSSEDTSRPLFCMAGHA